MKRVVKRGGRLGRVTTVAVALAVTLGLGPAAAPASGHAFAPALLELRAVAGSEYAVRWKQPRVRPAGAEIVPRLPPSCTATTPVAVSEEGTGVVARWSVDCPGGLAGTTIAVDGIASARADVLLRLELAGGGSIRHVLTADRPSFAVPAEERVIDVVAGYARLGVEHIVGGFDHLLFVLGLVLLVGRGRRLLWTVTAFTAGHSVTLALAASGFVHLPSAPVEVAIALSIYLLAVELARPAARRRETWMARRPGWMAGSFGLLHGLGFAGALSEVGLPAGDVPAALFGFNLGIELGQLAFVGAVLAVGVLVRRLSPEAPRRLAWVPAYGIGCLAGFWAIERGVAAFFSS